MAEANSGERAWVASWTRCCCRLLGRADRKGRHFGKCGHDQRDIDTGADHEHALRATVHRTRAFDDLGQCGDGFVVVMGQEPPTQIDDQPVSRIDHSKRRGVRLDAQQRRAVIPSRLAFRAGQRNRG